MDGLLILCVYVSLVLLSVCLPLWLSVSGETPASFCRCLSLQLCFSVCVAASRSICLLRCSCLSIWLDTLASSRFSVPLAAHFSLSLLLCLYHGLLQLAAPPMHPSSTVSYASIYLPSQLASYTNGYRHRQLTSCKNQRAGISQQQDLGLQLLTQMRKKLPGKIDSQLLSQPSSQLCNREGIEICLQPKP